LAQPVRAHGPGLGERLDRRIDERDAIDDAGSRALDPRLLVHDSRW
jgi:hypothetical protein